MRIFMTCTPHQILLSLSLSEMNDMGGACTTYEGEERLIHGFGGEY